MVPHEVYQANNGSSYQTLLSRIWPHLQPFVKLLCRVIMLIDSRTQKQSDRLLSVANYVYGFIEAPFLLLCLFYGTILSIITGIIAIPIIVVQSAIVFWPVIVSITLEVLTGLWRGFQQLCLDSGSTSDGTPDESAWPTLDTPEDYSGFVTQVEAATSTHFPDIIDCESSDVLEFANQPLRSWKVSDTVEESPRRSSLTSDLRISTSPFRRHRRTGTGSSSMSVASSPAVVRTPISMTDEAGEGSRRRQRSGSLSPEQLSG